VNSAVLGLVGGVIGYYLGTGSALILGPELAGLRVDPIPIHLVWFVLIAVAIAFFGNWYPVHRATRFDPSLILQEYYPCSRWKG
jgi:putative ABC transport system permease protein